MKPIVTFAFFLLAGFCGPAFADAGSDSADGCALIRPAQDATAGCDAVRDTLNAQVRDCVTKRQAEAYDFYRSGCGRDARIAQVWGPDAPFLK